MSDKPDRTALPCYPHPNPPSALARAPTRRTLRTNGLGKACSAPRRAAPRLEVEAAVARGLGPVGDEPLDTVARRKQELVEVGLGERRRERACVGVAARARSRGLLTCAPVYMQLGSVRRDENGVSNAFIWAGSSGAPEAVGRVGAGWGTQSCRAAWLAIDSRAHQAIPCGVPFLQASTAVTDP